MSLIMRQIMSSNSSCSDDEFSRIKEALDETFLTDDLYKNDKSKRKLKSLRKATQSLRKQDHQDVSVNPFSIKVTPEFQKHVSKHLSRLLDELIDDTEIIQKSKKLKVKRNIKSGVKLLSSSKDYLVSTINFNRTVKMGGLEEKDLNESDYKERAKEVAVTPEWVLSQEEIRHWAPETRGKIEIVKLGNSKTAY